MTQETVTINFSYNVGNERKTDSLEARARVKDVESEDAWAWMVVRQVLRTIGEIESDLIVKTPNGWFGNIKGFAEPQTELIGPLHLTIQQFPTLALDATEYTLNRRVDTPRRFDLP